ncbi:MAG: hypothetical protein WC829_00795 [Hyphomicrobium sp.]|jgi:hypothetical protein
MPKIVSLHSLDRYLAADLNGNPIPMRRRTTGAHSIYCAVGEVDAVGRGRTSLSDSVATHESMIDWRRTYIAAIAPKLSTQNVALLEAVFLHDPPLSLREVAVREDKKPQAISQRLHVLRRRHPELDSWWLAEHDAWKRMKAAGRKSHDSDQDERAA